MVLNYYKYVLVKDMKNKFHDMKKLEKQERINFIIGGRDQKQKLEQRNIELQQRIFDIKWNLDTIIELLEKGNNEKALKLLKKVKYNG